METDLLILRFAHEVCGFGGTQQSIPAPFPMMQNEGHTQLQFNMITGAVSPSNYKAFIWRRKWLWDNRAAWHTPVFTHLKCESPPRANNYRETTGVSRMHYT